MGFRQKRGPRLSSESRSLTCHPSSQAQRCARSQRPYAAPGQAGRAPRPERTSAPQAGCRGLTPRTARSASTARAGRNGRRRGPCPDPATCKPPPPALRNGSERERQRERERARERERERERGAGGLTRAVETPSPSNEPRYDQLMPLRRCQFEHITRETNKRGGAGITPVVR